MLLQYLETLKQVGTSPSTKIVVPMELGNLLSGLGSLMPGLSSNGSEAGTEAGPLGEDGPGTSSNGRAELKGGA